MSYKADQSLVKSELVGVLNVRKPTDWTSHDVVARLRRLAGQRRIGHAGTLDPMAEGVLPVLLGRATRLADLVGDGRKVYEARVQLGAATNTDDADGDVVETAPAPTLDPTVLEDALSRFRGPIQQVPPAFSAVKVQGRRAYAVARGGGTLDLQPRPVTVHALELLGRDGAALDLKIECSRGTYIRAIARDLARALGTVGHLTHLVRTRVGPFNLDEALTLDQLAERGVAACLLPPDAAVLELPTVRLPDDSLAMLGYGREVPVTGLKPGPIRVYDPSGERMLFLGDVQHERLKARITFYPDTGLPA